MHTFPSAAWWGHVRRLHPGRRLVAVVGLIPRARAAADRSGKRRFAGRRPTQESAVSRSSLR